jgi:hypothetical protein
LFWQDWFQIIEIKGSTSLYTAIKIDDRTATSMEGAIKQLHSILPKNALKQLL